MLYFSYLGHIYHKWISAYFYPHFFHRIHIFIHIGKLFFPYVFLFVHIIHNFIHTSIHILVETIISCKLYRNKVNIWLKFYKYYGFLILHRERQKLSFPSIYYILPIFFHITAQALDWARHSNTNPPYCPSNNYSMQHIRSWQHCLYTAARKDILHQILRLLLSSLILL